jgi:hypothetical protein
MSHSLSNHCRVPYPSPRPRSGFRFSNAALIGLGPLLVGLVLQLVLVPPAIAQDNTRRVINLFHGDKIRLTGVELSSGTFAVGAPQTLVYNQGTLVCLVVQNANLVWYDYSLGKAERSLAPSESELAPLTALSAIMTKVLPVPATPVDNSAQFMTQQVLKFMEDAPRDSSRIAWLIEYAAGKLRVFGDTVLQVEEVRRSSESPETAQFASGAPQSTGYVWARNRISELLPDPRVARLRDDLNKWYEGAKGGRDAQLTKANGYLTAAGARTPQGEDFARWSDIVLDALKAYGLTMADRADRFKKEFSSPDTWEGCARLGGDELSLAIGVKRKFDGPAKRAVADTFHVIAVTPRYAWKRIDIVTGIGIVVTPGTHSFAIRGSKVEDDGTETLVRPMISVSVPFGAFGSRDQNAWSIILGASAFDFAGQEKGGNILGHAGV